MDDLIDGVHPPPSPKDNATEHDPRGEPAAAGNRTDSVLAGTGHDANVISMARPRTTTAVNDDDVATSDHQYRVDSDTVATTPPEGGEQEATTTMDELGASMLKLLGDLEELTDHVGELDTAVDALTKKAKADEDVPAEWALFVVPERHEHPQATLQLWVDFYNATYVTTTQSVGEDHNRAIPGCWHQHPGLAAEVATLAATWRAAFVGPTADPANAQNFHDRWRPSFAQRLRTWAPCSTERHTANPNGSPERLTRFDL